MPSRVWFLVCYIKHAAVPCVLQQRSGSFTSTAGKGISCSVCVTTKIGQFHQHGW